MRITAIVVTHDHADAIERSLPAVLRELSAGDELLVVDNASSDGTAEAVERIAPAARLIRAGGNGGFAAGCNAGAREAGGELLVFLNPDAVVEPGFGEAIRLGAGRGWIAWMGLVAMEGGATINTSGGIVHFTGISWSGGVGKPVGAAGGPREVPFASGACLAIRRADYLSAEGMPEAFFLYMEDVDLSLRLRLAGGRVGVEPAAVVDHDYEFAKGPHKWRMLERNRWATLIRTFPGALLAAIAPALVLTELGLLAVAVAGGWLPQKLRAYGDTARSLRRLLAERREIQSRRAISAVEFAAFLTPDLASPYLGRAATLAPLRAGLRLYWRLVLATLSRTST